MLPEMTFISHPDLPRVAFSPPESPINPGKCKGFRVMLARFPGFNQEHPDSSGYFMKILPQLHADALIERVVPFKRSSTPIPMVRNEAVLSAIKEQCDYILMIDSDMCPDCEDGSRPFWETAWNFMVRRRIRESNLALSGCELAPCVIAAPYCGAPPDEPVCVLNVRRTNGSGNPDSGYVIETMDRHDVARRTGIGRVDAIGTGLILFDTRVFYYLPPPWFAYEYKDAYEASLATTEDVFMTRNASLLDIPVYCAWDCWSGHWKMKLVQKPDPCCMEILTGSIREAFEHRYSRDSKLHFVHPDGPHA
jgi:hypothetical protein